MFGINTLLAILFIWLFVITLFVLYQIKVYRALSSGVAKKDIVSLLNSIINAQKEDNSRLKGLEKKVSSHFTEGLSHVKKIGVVRFNPFNEMGGDHSFSLTILDGKDNGFILTSLHARERTRTYLKSITNGKSKQNLSKDEEKSLKIALEK